jgi:hypothetical protein
MLNILFTGILDSLKFWYPIHLIIGSSRIKRIFVISFILNFLIFSINFYYSIIVSNWYPEFWNTFYWIFLILWEIPCFIVATYVNHYYGGQLTELICKKKYDVTQRTTKQSVSEMVYGTLLIYSTYVMLMVINSTIDWIWLKYIISYLGYSWLIAYYLFEPRMVYKGYTLKQRISFFQHRWLYFLGYGSIWGVLYISYPYRILYSLYYCVMNLLVLNTIHLVPLKYDYIESIPIFGITGSFTDYLLLQIDQITNSQINSKN